MQAYYAAPPTVAAASTITPPPSRKRSSLTSATKEIHVDVKKLERIYHQKNRDDSPFKPIVNTTTSGVGVYQLDNRTLVIYINTFEPGDYFAFQSTVVQGMYYANFYGLDRSPTLFFSPTTLSLPPSLTHSDCAG